MRRLSLLLALLASPAWAQSTFPLKDGDVWVMAGDSITAQHQHSNYFEAYCYARFPNMKFAFRNSGVGGHTIPSTLARFDYDIAAWKPTVVSVELGMNDKGGTETAKFIANMKVMVDRIRATGARPVILAPSPVNNGDTMAKLGGNQRLHEYSVALKEFCAAEKIPYGDQFHALLDVWGKNKPNENLLTLLGQIKGAAGNKSLAGAEHLQAFLAVHEKSSKDLVTMMGDPVHPGQTGQLMMAAALLKQLGAPGQVSSATLGKKGADGVDCKLTNVKVESNSVSFDRLDACSAFPIPEEARRVLALDPTILEMSQYLLTVTDLQEGNYDLKVNGIVLGTLSAKELASGVNLTAFPLASPVKGTNPIAAQGKAILDAISARATLVGQWRGQSKVAHDPGAAPKLKEALAVAAKKIEEADQRIRDAAAPRSYRFEITPSK